MGGKRRRGVNVASPNRLQPDRVTDVLWGLAITAPEHPLAQRDDGPIGSAFSRDLQRREPAPSDDTSDAEAEAEADPPLPPTINSTMFPKSVPSPPPGWPGLADDPITPAGPPPERHRMAEPSERPSIEELLRPRASAREPISRELIEEVGWWARNGRRMRGDEWREPPRPAQSVPQPAPAARMDDKAPMVAASEQLAAADAQREQGDTPGAARSIGSSLAIAVDVPGGVERHESVSPVLERARQLVSPAAREQRQTSAAELAMLERFEERWRRGERLDAVLELRTFLRSDGSGRAVERLLAAERALALRHRERICVGGEALTVVFGRAAWLGRSDVDIEVPSPLVSRQHLLFVAGEAGPIARDHASANGTFASTAGPRLEQLIDKPMELRLGGEVAISVEPFGAGHLRVRTPGETTLLVLGEQLLLEGVELSRWQASDLAGWRFRASAEAVLDDVALRSGELARGDRLRIADLTLSL
jgi:hypothetical protein